MAIRIVADVSHVRNVPQWTKKQHQFEVKPEPYGTGIYINAADFGCSRAYKTSNPVQALQMFLAEHACTPHNVQLIEY